MTDGRDEIAIEARVIALRLSNELHRDADEIERWLTGVDPMERRRRWGMVVRRGSVLGWREGAKRARQMIDAGGIG